jgi:hypothetical protein
MNGRISTTHARRAPRPRTSSCCIHRLKSQPFPAVQTMKFTRSCPMATCDPTWPIRAVGSNVSFGSHTGCSHEDGSAAAYTPLEISYSGSPALRNPSKNGSPIAECKVA